MTKDQWPYGGDQCGKMLGHCQRPQGHDGPCSTHREQPTSKPKVWQPTEDGGMVEVSKSTHPFDIGRYVLLEDYERLTRERDALLKAPAEIEISLSQENLLKDRERLRALVQSYDTLLYGPNAEIKRLRAALERYGVHDEKCPARESVTIQCTCGFVAFCTTCQRYAHLRGPADETSERQQCIDQAAETPAVSRNSQSQAESLEGETSSAPVRCKCGKRDLTGLSGNTVTDNHGTWVHYATNCVEVK